MHKATAVVNDYGIHGDGIIVLFNPFEWSEKEIKLAEETENVA